MVELLFLGEAENVDRGCESGKGQDVGVPTFLDPSIFIYLPSHGFSILFYLHCKPPPIEMHILLTRLCGSVPGLTREDTLPKRRCVTQLGERGMGPSRDLKCRRRDGNRGWVLMGILQGWCLLVV